MISSAQLKAELQKRGLPTYGAKKNLIARLDINDPSGKWTEDIAQAEKAGAAAYEATTMGAVEGERENEDETTRDKSMQRAKTSREPLGRGHHRRLT